MVTPTKLEGCFIIQPKVFEDDRGYFVETFNQAQFNKLTGLNVHFVQDNESKSNKNVVRGLHMQTAPYAQAKLVRVTTGAVIDVAVDVRKNSPTFMQHIAVLLTGNNKTQLYIPHGFLHGFAVLEDNTIFNYKCDNFYNKDGEAGMHPLNNELGVQWQINIDHAIVSAKDAALLNQKDFMQNLK